MLAGLLKGPNYNNPDRHPDRAKQRLAYVLDRMQEDGVITAAQKNEALASPPKLIAFALPHRDSGFDFVDFLGHEAKADGVSSLTAEPYTVHSTINAQLQHDTEAALQEGLAHYEISTGRAEFRGPEANIADAVRALEVDSKTGLPAWQAALQALHLPLYDVHWTPAVVLERGGKSGDGPVQVGISDGRILPLTTWSASIKRDLSLYDVVYVHVVEPKSAATKSVAANIAAAKRKDQTAKRKAAAAGAQAQLRVRPTVQGAALVLENKTGRILAMAGSFSYPLSQLNRTVQTQRQPGSAMKPVTYLTALQHGLQPNTLILNEPITFPPIGIGNRDAIDRDYDASAREEDYWSPRNDDYSEGGVYTLRRGLENSVNVVTAHLLDGGVDANPEKSLDDICATAVAAKIYSQCVRYYPFVLGAQPVRMLDLAAFYAAIANDGALPQPHGIDSVEEDGRTVYRYPDTPLPRIGAADPASFYQLKSILQGVVARGTARAIAALSPYVAGKTGTTEDFVDGWFIGFTNDVTVAVWVGYDNGNGKRRSLGTNEDGARVALPIFEPIIEAVWADHIAPKTPLSGPSPQARRELVDIPIDYMSGDPANGGNFIEHFRRGADGQVADTQFQLVSRGDAYAYQSQDWGNNNPNPFWGGAGDESGRSYYPNRGWQPLASQPPPPQQPVSGGFFGLFRPWSQQSPPPPPPQNYFWGGR
jgi:membrane carboxypeptidase/penicillin-binding protein